MPQITIEYMIMIPLMILQIFLFPLTAGWIMNIWVDSRQTLALQETASYIGSSVHQVYSVLDQHLSSFGTVSNILEIPSFIEGYMYNGSASVREAETTSAQILDISLTFVGGSIEASTSVTLGHDLMWDANSEFMSNSTNVSLVAERMMNGTILMYFEGD